MKIALWCFFFLFFIRLGFGQFHLKELSLEQKFDSLQRFPRNTKNDSLLIKTLTELTWFTQNLLIAENRIKKLKNICNISNWENKDTYFLAAEGFFLMRKNKYYESIISLNECLYSAEKSQIFNLIAFSNRYLGANYYFLKKYNQSILHYDKSLQFFLNKSDEISRKNYYVILSNIALSNIELMKYDLAIKKFTEAINLAELNKDSLSLGWFYGNMGIALFKNSRFKDSEENFNKSLLFLQKGKSQFNIALSQSYLSQLYLKRNALSKAIQYGQSAFKNAENENSEIERIVLENLYILYKSIGEDRKALKYFEEMVSLNKANDSTIREKTINGLQALYENQKKESEIKIQKNRNSLLVAIGLFVFILLLFTLYSRYKVLKQAKLIENQKINIEEINSQLEEFNSNLEVKIANRTEALQNAVLEIQNSLVRGELVERERMASLLHNNFGGVITSIKFQMQAINGQNLTDTEKKIYGKIYEQITEIYDEIRGLSHELKPNQENKETFYQKIVKHTSFINQTEKLEVNLIIDEDIKFKNRTDDEIYSITLELINNTIKHANSTKICINLKKEERVIRYIYSDNGNGFSKTKKNGMGLEEIRKKVNSMYGTIEISNLSSGFELIINLPDFVEGFLVG